MKIRVEASESGERLDKLLAQRFAGVSRATIMKFLKEGAARINGRAARPGARVQEGDDILLPEWEEAVDRIRGGRPAGHPQVERERPKSELTDDFLSDLE